MTTVYAICCDEAVKIGVTQNSVESRMAEMQTGNPVQLKIWAKYKTQVMTSFQLERLIHERLVGSHIRGEWYFPTRQVMDVLRAMADGYIEKFMQPDIVLPELVSKPEGPDDQNLLRDTLFHHTGLEPREFVLEMNNDGTVRNVLEAGEEPWFDGAVHIKVREVEEGKA